MSHPKGSEGARVYIKVDTPCAAKYVQAKRAWMTIKFMVIVEELCVQSLIGFHTKL